jgi:hypothetical protein
VDDLRSARPVRSRSFGHGLGTKDRDEERHELGTTSRAVESGETLDRPNESKAQFSEARPRTGSRDAGPAARAAEPDPSSTLTRLSRPLKASFDARCVFPVNGLHARCGFFESLSGPPANGAIAFQASREENFWWGAAHGSRRGRDPHKAAKPTRCEPFRSGGFLSPKSESLRPRKAKLATAAVAGGRVRKGLSPDPP